MLGALKLVFAGGIYIPPEILNHETWPIGEDTDIRSPFALGLTKRQAELLQLLAQGKSNVPFDGSAAKRRKRRRGVRRKQT